MTPDELLALVDDAVVDWAVVREDIPDLPPHLLLPENVKWITYYAKTRGWYR